MQEPAIWRSSYQTQARARADIKKIMKTSKTGRGSRRMIFHITMLIDWILRARDFASDLPARQRVESRH